MHLLCGSWSGAKFFIRDIRQANSGLFHFSENQQDLLPKGWHSTDEQRSPRCRLASPSQSNRTNISHIYRKDEWIGLEWLELGLFYLQTSDLSCIFGLTQVSSNIFIRETFGKCNLFDEPLKFKIEKGHQYKHLFTYESEIKNVLTQCICLLVCMKLLSAMEEEAFSFHCPLKRRSQ